MEYPPDKKAAAMADLAKGHSLGKVAKDHGIPRATVQTWANQLKEGTGLTTLETKEGNFVQAVERFGTATMDMLTAQCELLTDPLWLKTQKTEDVIAHTKFVRDSFEGIIRLQALMSGRREALPEREPETVRAELVDV